MRPSFRLLVLFSPFSILPISALKLSVSTSPSATSEHVTITTSWKHEEKDPTSGTFELLVVEETVQYSASTPGLPRLLSSFPIPSDDSGSFVSVLALSAADKGTITARAVDSKHNVFARSNTISLDDHTPGTGGIDTTTGSSGTSTSTSTHHTPFPSTATPSATKMEDQNSSMPNLPLATQTQTAAPGGSTTGNMSVSGGSAVTNHTLGTILGVTIPIVFLVLLVIFICGSRYWSRRNRERDRNRRRSFDVDFSAKDMVVVVGRATAGGGGGGGGHSDLKPPSVMEEGRYGGAVEAELGRGVVETRSLAEIEVSGPRLGGERSSYTVHGRKKSKVSFVLPPAAGHGKPKESHQPHALSIPFQIPLDPHHHQEVGVFNVISNTATSSPSTLSNPNTVPDILPYSPSEPLLPPPPLTPNQLRRMTPDVPLDLDDQGHSLRIRSFGGISLDSRI
ncbi:hypothetical protein L218DRAFT_742394 [Marasmius fiardii PR-910]|nr:hypothetical protein L218DRAFT_742394 [Marasmius fiardii PR-910]